MTKEPLMKGGPKGMPEVYSFDPSQLAYQDAEGKAHPIHQRVRVIGRVRYALQIDKDPRSPTGQRFTSFLTQVTLEAPPGS